MDLIITILPVVTKDLPISPRFTPYNFLSRCKFRTLTTRQPMVEFYLLTFPRFPLRKKEHKSYLSKNRTHDVRTSRCAAYLLDHSGDCTLILLFSKRKLLLLFKRKIRTRLDLLSIPQSRGKNVKTFRWDHRLQIQNLFMAFKRVPRW